MAGLHPVVIPAIEYTYKSIKYTCSGEGLYKDGYLYDAHPEKYFPPRKATSVPKEIEKKPVAYWKAQCAFRGLNQTGAINDLQLRLREAKKPMLPELKDAEKMLNKEFSKKNKAARDGSWKSLKTAEQKAKADPKKFLAEVFPKGATGRPANLDIVVVKVGTDERFALSEMAEKMSLETLSVDAPWGGTKKPTPDRWLIIGRTRDAIWNQMREIERETARSKQNLPTDKPKPQTPKQNAPKLSKESKTPKSAPPQHRPQQNQDVLPKNPPYGPLSRPPQTARKSVVPDREPRPYGANPDPQTAIKPASPIYGQSVTPSSSHDKKPDNSWDIRGSYEVNCPAILEQWDPHGDLSLTLDLYLETRGGKPQLYGMFNFGVVEGIMRFEKPIPVPKSEKPDESTPKKRKWDDDPEDLDLQDYPAFNASSYGESANESYDEKVFFLGAKDKPTARRPTWRYRWRGTETGEGEIQ
jgi:hypothetical protein